MDREIKFRAWDKYRGENGLMLENHTFHSISETGLYNSEGLIWMQYTGLKDKNGKECYEGDIKEWRFNHHIWLSVCYWSDIDCGFRWRRIKHNSKFEDYEDEYETEEEFNLDMKTSNQRGIGLDSWSEIIGNIYENPELTREGK